jgi:hypothetical protein
MTGCSALKWLDAELFHLDINPDTLTHMHTSQTNDVCRPPYLRGAPQWLDGEVGKVSVMDKDTAQTTPHELTQ